MEDQEPAPAPAAKAPPRRAIGEFLSIQAPQMSAADSVRPSAAAMAHPEVAAAIARTDAAELAALADEGHGFYLVSLPPRFRVYVEERAQAHGVTPEATIAAMVRGYWQKDDWRATNTAPREMGEPAGTSRRR